MKSFSIRGGLIWISQIVWALWFGCTISVFVFGTQFQHVLPTAIFHEAVHAMFQVFAKYELILSGTAILLSGALLVSYPTKWSVVLVGFLILAAGMTVAVALGLMPRMEVLRNEGQTGSPEFIKLHIKSMIALAIQAVVLLLSGLVIFMAARESLAVPEEEDGSIEASYEKRMRMRRGL
jgi:hypothetical protein